MRLGGDMSRRPKLMRPAMHDHRQVITAVMAVDVGLGTKPRLTPDKDRGSIALLFEIRPTS